MINFQRSPTLNLNIPKGELSGLQVNLVDELPGWGNDDDFRLLELTEGAGCHTIRHQLLQNREQECSLEGKRYIYTCKLLGHKQTHRSAVYSLLSHRFTRSSLGTGHEISASSNDWDAMLLHRGRLRVTRLVDVFSQGLTQCCLIKSLKEKELNCTLIMIVTHGHQLISLQSYC